MFLSIKLKFYLFNLYCPVLENGRLTATLRRVGWDEEGELEKSNFLKSSSPPQQKKTSWMLSSMNWLTLLYSLKLARYMVMMRLFISNFVVFQIRVFTTLCSDRIIIVKVRTLFSLLFFIKIIL